MSEARNGKDRILEIGGISVPDLAKACGTPLFVYDEKELDQQMSDYKTYFRSDQFETEVIYASKAFTCKALLQMLDQNGLSLDVVSGGELYMAKQAGFPMERIYFHGNNKTDEEIKLALDLGCKTIVLDSLMECERVVTLADSKGCSTEVMIRINPGITAHTHKYIITGNLDSKFGVMFHDEETILKMLDLVKNSKFTTFTGFHAHIGSQIFDLRAYDAVIERLIKYIKKLNRDHKIEIECLDFGGGFGVRYTEEDQPNEVQEVCSRIIKKCEEELLKYDLHLKKIMIEPGRSIVAEAGNTIYQVGFMKKTPNKEYLFVDGGMTDNIRVALYDARYDCDLAEKMDREKEYRYTVAGKCCESGDILIEDAMLPKAETGDLLIVYGTGAYGYSMANNYNRISRPAVVFVKDGKARIVIKRESYSDQLRLEANEEVII
ncbi:diaminopimelate decarboxylase [Anoxybacterium hadale]|uniref:Diaminopimelate decarboxylase n=1 Tax=Anoxybacterium hadale TaxID=3408580 RepID=A0ACD1AA37_9FIRM|nr:diaminopimelate decarboxylase [Clostridiales bacterium]